MIRQEFQKGEKARLDAKYNNSSIIEIVYQTRGKLFTRVKSGDHEWDVMTVRLDKILNEETAKDLPLCTCNPQDIVASKDCKKHW